MWLSENKMINVVVNDFFHELKAIDNEEEYSNSIISDSPVNDRPDPNKARRYYAPIISENTSITTRNYPLTERRVVKKEVNTKHK